MGDAADRRVIALDANSSAVEWVERLTNAADGGMVARSHRYIEVVTGLNYQDQSGRWRESEDLIELTDDGGAAASRGPHKVHFNANLNTAGAISITTVSNRVLRTHVLGLYYFDAATGQSALIAPVQDSIGELLAPNQIIYHDAFHGILADVRITYTKAGVETDVILLEKPQSPEEFGLSSLTTRLEIWHEFLDPPLPNKKAKVLKQETNALLRQSMAEPDLVDETLDFGDAWFPLGRAFWWEAATNSTGAPAQILLFNPATETNQVLVAKQWLQIQQRNLLIESVEWPDIAPRLESLPPVGKVANTSNLKKRVANGRQLPATKVAIKKSSKPIRVAAAPYRTRGYVFDYVMVATSGTDYTFSEGVTYYVTSTYFSGTLTFQPNCVIKMANYGSVMTYGAIVCNGRTGSYSILTSADDDLYGAKIAASTGVPTYAGSPALLLYYLSSGATVRGMKIRWARTAVEFDPTYDNSSHAFQFSALEQCQTGLLANGPTTVSISYSTKCGVTTPLYDGGCNCAFTGSLADNCNGDTDSDGLPDSWEIAYFGSVASQNGSADADGDGLTNFQEYQGGTNPRSPDILKIFTAEPKSNANIP